MFVFSVVQGRDGYPVFKNWFAETLVFIVFFGCALFGPSCQKGKYGPPKIRTENFD